eukprot:2556943-Pleurochrysis_carterae.AAC.1
MQQRSELELASGVPRPIWRNHASISRCPSVAAISPSFSLESTWNMRRSFEACKAAAGIGRTRSALRARRRDSPRDERRSAIAVTTSGCAHGHGQSEVAAAAAAAAEAVMKEEAAPRCAAGVPPRCEARTDAGCEVLARASQRGGLLDARRCSRAAPVDGFKPTLAPSPS